MVDGRGAKRLAAVVLVLGVAAWLIASLWTHVLLGIPGAVGFWTTWTWPAVPDPSLSVLGPFVGGAGMFILAIGLMFAVALVGAWQRPLLPRLTEE